MNIQPVNESTLYLILPFKVSQLALLYAKKHGISTTDAIKKIYNSETYKDLENEKTKLWHYGPVALLDTLEEEFANS